MSKSRAQIRWEQVERFHKFCEQQRARVARRFRREERIRQRLNSRGAQQAAWEDMPEAREPLRELHLENRGVGW